MRFLFDPMREQEIKLEKFRQSFLLLISDGQYPPERQQRLFQACRTIGLDWDEARRHVIPDAIAFLQKMVKQIVSDGKITSREIAELRRMQRRLAIPDDQTEPVLARLFDFIEQRLASKIIDHAAYLGEPAIVAELKQELARYDLPPVRTQRLVAQLDRQHEFAKMMTGNLPVVMPSIALFHNEVCHLDIPTTVLTTNPGGLLEGRLVVTSQRLMVLAAAGGMTITWPQCRAIESAERSLVLVSTVQSAMIMCDDPQYVATLVASARRRYVPQPLPEPLRPGKRLAL